MLTKFAKNFVRYLILFFFSAISLLPFIWIGFWSLKTETEIRQSPFSIPLTPHLENFIKVWNRGHYSIYLPNTLIYAIAIVTGVCVISCLAGYALARLRFPARDQLFTLFLVGLMVPFFALMVPIYLLTRDLGLLGTRLGFIVPAIAMALPFGIFLMRSFFRALPNELAEAARIDGCTEFEVFWKVMLPLAYPGLASLAVFEFLWTWNMFVEPLVLAQSDKLRPVGLAIFFFIGQYNVDRSMIAAGIIFTVIPVLILYLLFQRQFIEGVTAGALK